ncbi:MAG: DNA translocase FtsK 4TM domain-containing protein [Anaerolineae bacterium]|nr:DNA translocase FtsK 4TM domain-containing protein [Anaerolineae bacterium]
MRKPAAKNPSKKGNKANPTPHKPLLTPDQWLDVLGYALIGLALFAILSALSPGGQSDATAGLLHLFRTIFGWGALFAAIVMGLFGFYLVLRRFGDRFPRLAPSRLLGVLVGFLSVLMTMHIIARATYADTQALVEAGAGGGRLGAALVDGLSGAVGNAGAILIVLIGWGIAVMLTAQLSVGQIVLFIRRHVEGPSVASEGNADGVIVPSWDREARPRAIGQIGASADDHPHRSTMGDLIINGLRKRAARKPPRVDAPLDDDLPPASPPARSIVGVPTAGVSAPQAAAQALSQQSGGEMLRNRPTAERSRRLPPPRIIGGSGTSGPLEAAAQPAVTPSSISSPIDNRQDWKLPPVERVLEPGSDASLKEADIRRRAQVIEETLLSFGVPGRVVEVNQGPTITQFGVEPGFIDTKSGKQIKVKVSKIAALADDLALALSAPRIRIEAPVPGRAIVGIEVPNLEPSIVALRDVMESEEFVKLGRKSRLRLALGQDVSGRAVVADLTSMPHLLIAGTTGSGKSVCVNAIITALLCHNSPQDLRLLMVDPKRVELTGYNGIPHLLSPVVVDIEKVTGVLAWVTREMEKRYRLFSKHGVRNILDFNAKVAEVEAQPPDSLSAQPDDLKRIPYIVVIIDELADLMMLAPDETEKTLCRLAQMARATGIHLIIATQRPSVDVVTGLIKANFPARIAFTVATSTDSRVILDAPGAEKLLGRGDMLIVTPDSPLPTRAQGCWVSDKEINGVVRHWRAQAGAVQNTDSVTASLSAPSVPLTGTLDGAARPIQMPLPDSTPPLTWDEARALSNAMEETGGNKEDKLFEDAVATVRLQGKASISLLQRRLRIGYTRAARLIELMEERGIVGPSVPGSQFREVLPAASRTGADSES